MAERVKDSIDIAAPAEQVFEVAADIETYPEWSPNIKQVEVSERDNEGRPLVVWFEVDAKIKVLRYTLRYDYSRAPESFSWSLVEGDVRSLDGSYTFDDFGDVTEVTYEIAIEPGFPVPGMLKRQAERQIVKGALDDLKRQVES